MTIYITDKNETRSIQLKSWDGSNWSPDCFADVADTTTRDYPISEQQREECPDASAAMTAAEYDELVAWWETEVTKYNDRDGSSWFFECSDPETATDELALIAD